MKLILSNKSPHADPSFAKAGDSGMDLRAWVKPDESDRIIDGKPYIVLKPGERRLIHTGIYCELPENTEIQVRPKSGRALREGLSIVNTPGTVDECYRGEICVISVNLSTISDIIIKDGDAFAQMVLMPVYNQRSVEIVKTDEISTDTERGKGGFGHTGL